MNAAGTRSSAAAAFTSSIAAATVRSCSSSTGSHRAPTTGACCWNARPSTPPSPRTSSASASPRSRGITTTRCTGRPTWSRSSSTATASPKPVFIVAHDMGTSVATELMARDLEGALDMDLVGVLLLNGSMIQDAASPDPRPAPSAQRRGTALLPALQRAVLPPAVRLDLLPGTPAHGRGGRGPVGADLRRRRPDAQPQDDPLHGGALSSRRALARSVGELGEASVARLGDGRSRSRPRTSWTPSWSCARRLRSPDSTTSATTPRSRIRSVSRASSGRRFPPERAPRPPLWRRYTGALRPGRPCI